MKRKTTRFLFTSMAAAIALCWVSEPGVLAQTTTPSAREAAKTRVKQQRQQLQAATGGAAKVTDTTVMNAQAMMAPATGGFQDYSLANYANSPFLSKFKDALPGLCATPTALNCIPVATPATLADGSQYYEIGVREYRQQMHSELPSVGTLLRGYYQKNGPDTRNSYLGPVIVAKRDVPVRIKFFNEKAPDGKHIIPVDTTVMGAGAFEVGDLATSTIVGNFGENRSGIHLHGGFTPWISDGTPHQWVSPVGETGDYKEGVSLKGVPDMDGGVVGNGVQTLYYPNQQSNRLMFYHDHAYGITRLNVYAGEAAGYLLYDSVEEALVNANTIPNLGGVYKFGIPLVIQDKSFVHAGSAAGAATIPATTVADPTWTQVGGSPATGDLWFPHVYVPNQDPYGMFSTSTPDGMNMMGRWDYGPWIWPPAAAQVPDTLPNPSIVPEAFMDTMLVNGKAYPFLNVNRRAYRFRVLNASNDRFMNLQLYYAFNPAAAPSGRVCNSSQQAATACTEIKMVPRDGKTYTVSSPGEVTVTSTVPDDAFRGSVPDPTTAGPKMLQIGNEGGFLPQAIVRNNPPVPITYDTDPKSMTVGNVKAGTIILGPAERADIVIDFSRVPAGSTLILYNDAPAAFPAGDPRYDYFTGSEDLTANGGAPSIPVGKGPNTRTIMQFRVQGGSPAPQFNFAALQAALPTAYSQTQDKPLVPQPDYNVGGWAGQFPTTPNYARIFDKDSFTFKDKAGNAVTLPIHNKAIAEEFDVAYGRMSALLGTEAQITNNQGQNTFGFTYIDPSTENLPAGVTQIWKITHNGVDTHAIHWHLVNVQVINRVDWAGVVKAPDPDEIGWKETVRMNPLEDIIVAVQAKAPVLPAAWGSLPDSVRPKDVTQPLGSMMGFTQPWPYVADDPTKQPLEFQTAAVNPANTMNELTNYGWEYVWHCHLLGHEENDMMRPLVLTQVTGGLDAIPPVASAALSPAPNAAGWNNTPVSLTLSATDNAPGALAIEYSTDAGATWTPYSAPVSLIAETPLAGTTVQYRATDAAGNVSAVGTALAKIDLTAPVYTVAPTVTKPANNAITIAGAAADGLSGLVTGTGAGTYSITGPSPSSGSFSIASNGTFSFGRTKLKAGAYTATISVKDVAGNMQTAVINFTNP